MQGNTSEILVYTHLGDSQSRSTSKKYIPAYLLSTNYINFKGETQKWTNRDLPALPWN
jgi:hypothetical protein